MALYKLVFALSLCACKPSPASPDVDAAVAEAEAQTRELQAALQAELVAAIEAGGPVSAIGVCQVRAPELAHARAGEGRVVGRTALRVRNPANTASDWQRAVLEDFVARAAAGEDPAGLTWHEVVDRDARPTLRYMRAIPMGGLCLACHGGEADISPETLAKLKELYPEDRATGFAVGEVRGAFVVTAALD